MREKWFPEVHHHCPGVPCLIVGTQVDLRDDPSVREKLSKQKMQPVRREDGERMAKELGAVKYVECSALTQYKLKDVFDEVRTVTLGAPTGLLHLLLGRRQGLRFDIGFFFCGESIYLTNRDLTGHRCCPRAADTQEEIQKVPDPLKGRIVSMGDLQQLAASRHRFWRLAQT